MASNEVDGVTLSAADAASIHAALENGRQLLRELSDTKISYQRKRAHEGVMQLEIASLVLERNAKNCRVDLPTRPRNPPPGG